MTKAEAKALLESTGEINHFSATENWRKVFDVFNQHHPGDRASLKCGSCYGRVKKWLLS